MKKNGLEAIFFCENHVVPGREGKRVGRLEFKVFFAGSPMQELPSLRRELYPGGCIAAHQNRGSSLLLDFVRGAGGMNSRGQP